MNVIVTTTISGNLFNATHWLNHLELADYLVTAQPNGNYTIIMLRMPKELHEALKANGVRF